MPSTTSTRNTALPPPPALPRSSTSQIPPRPSGSTPPVFVSNDELLSMFALMKDSIHQQQDTNRMLIREIQALKSSSRRPSEDMGTPLQPMALDFNSSFSGGVHQGDFIPMSSGFSAPEMITVLVKNYLVKIILYSKLEIVR